MSVVHGGNVYEISSLLGCAPEAVLDYSASINPLGPPPGLLEEFNRYYSRLQHYPDIGNRMLLNALSRFHGVACDQIVVGNGSTELIYWLPIVLGIRSAVVVLPTFGEYRKAFELQGVRMHKLFTSPESGFQPTVEQLDTICREVSPEAVLFTQPASPAGTLLPQEVRNWIVRKSRETNLCCIVDEVFVDFCEDESLKGFLGESPRLVLIRSMTKFYGIPGLRLGYLLTSEDLAGRMKSALPPWSVNTLAQIAGEHSLGQEGYRRETLDIVERERRHMTERLEAMKVFRVFPGNANYLLVRIEDSLPDAGVLQRDIIDSERIIVRDCRSFEGLNERYFRLAVRLPEQNDRLLAGIERWVKAYSSGKP
ncbi:MAG: threonine-phosphate decarboxylase [Syntrophobacteraceae bacterium]|nr:pyridoxal phosphate-dependent class II aminotransferase [Desulfobacteraceae bacterium]